MRSSESKDMEQSSPKDVGLGAGHLPGGQQPTDSRVWPNIDSSSDTSFQSGAKQKKNRYIE